MKVLLIADPTSIFTAQYIDNVLRPAGAQVFLAHRDAINRAATSPYRSAYESDDVVVIADKVDATARIPKVRTLANGLVFRLALLRYGPFDVRHVHYVSPHSAQLALTNLRRSGRLVASFWGSDLLRSSEERLRSLAPLLSKADVVTASTDPMLKSLAEVFGSWVSPKLTKVHFGVPGLQCIKEVVSEEGRAGSRKALSIPEGRITLTVGYNGRVAQQHLRVMEEVSGLSAALLARVHLLLPFTYGVQSSAYRREVEQVASRLGVGFTIFDDYMDCWEQARLALSTDIYINAQTTDMFSASMQEFLYAGSVMLKGGWLDYPELDRMGSFYLTFSTFPQLREVLNEAIDGFEQLRLTSAQCNQKIADYTSWGAVADSWMALYQESG